VVDHIVVDEIVMEAGQLKAAGPPGEILGEIQYVFHHTLAFSGPSTGLIPSFFIKPFRACDQPPKKHVQLANEL